MMKKGILIWLIAGMALSLIGISAIQSYWINDAFEVKRTQLDQQVNLAMSNTIDVLKQRESVTIFKQHTGTSNGNHPNIIIKRSDTIVRSDLRTEDLMDLPTGIDTTILRKGQVHIEVSSDEEFDTEVIHQQLEQHISIDNELENAGGLSDRFTNLIKKMVMEFKDIDDPVAHLLVGIDLQELLQKQLKAKGVDAPVEYAIIEGDKVIRSSDDFKAEMKASSYRQHLFPNPIMKKEHELLVAIPNQDAYIWNKMLGLLVLSTLFTLAIIAIFWVTVRNFIKQKKLSAIKSDFINNMTHELKTPIATVSLAVDAILHPDIRKDDEKLEHFAGIIRKENKRMNKQVEHVLRTSLAERGDLNLQLGRIDMHGIIAEMVERTSVHLGEVDTLDTHLEANNAFVHADELHIGNVIANLLDNAIKYGKDTINVTVRSSNNDGKFIVEVEDQGIGMTNEEQEKAFDKFYRAQGGNIHEVKGAGIGLSYVKAIVEAHGGEVSLKSAKDKGTTVTVTLPSWT